MIEHVRPAVDGGAFAVKRSVDEVLAVTADVFGDGHDHVRAVLGHRPPGRETWAEIPMEELGNDRFRGELVPAELGRHRYRVTAWIDQFATWRDGARRKATAGVDVAVDLRIGEQLLQEAAGRADRRSARRLAVAADALASGHASGVLADDGVAELAGTWSDRTHEQQSEPELPLDVDRELARCSVWYELFPRSAGAVPGRPGTFADVEAQLPDLAAMGFDVLYLPPIHPIGETHRKGPNNAPQAAPGNPGSPWAIGGAAGGHTSIHPDLGTPAELRRLVAAARATGLELALDVAFQCSPDHPWVTEHPEWFRHRPDGTIQYAENPPKRYEDIYPFDFECDDWPALWEALRDVFEHWIGEGVLVFRVDNPHTKPFEFWEWVLTDLRSRHPETIFLAEAFTRPRVMERLAKLGFNQSYTYFAWRNSAWELRQYFEELTATDLAEYFRPNVWPNTPDILTEYLQYGGRPAFTIRAVLAATLAASYGVYGPAFEHLEHVAREPGSEEYLDSEKYQLRAWDPDPPDSIRPVLTRLNRIRAANPALRSDRTLRFHDADDDHLLCYSKRDPLTRNTVLTVVNVDPHHRHAGHVHLDLEALGVTPGSEFEVDDLFGGGHYTWHGPRNYVELDPHVLPAHVFLVGSGAAATGHGGSDTRDDADGADHADDAEVPDFASGPDVADDVAS